MADLRTEGAGDALERLKKPRRHHAPRGHGPTGRGPQRHSSGSTLGPPGAGEGGAGEHTVTCDLLAVSGGSAPATSLLTQSGAKTGYDERLGHFVLREVPEGLHAAGQVVGADQLREAERSGRRGRSGRRSRARARRRVRAGAGGRGTEAIDERPAPAVAVPPAVTSSRRGKCSRHACARTSHTAKDIHLSVEEGYDSIELS